MDPIAIALAVLLAGALAAILLLGSRLKHLPERLEGERGILDQTLRELRAELAAERDKAAAALREAAASREARAAAESRQAEAVEQLDRRLADHERMKAEFLALTRSTTLAELRDLSAKLIEDHKRDAAETAKQREEHVEATTKGLVEQFEHIRSAVAELKGQVGEKTEKIDNIWRALTSPAGAGSFAEIALANVLRSFKLEEGRDFVLQLTTQNAETGRRLRPDAVVFLPADTVLVIDCKASKFLHDIAQAEGGPGEEEAYRNLARTMQIHLRSLAEKDYRSAVAADCRRSGRGDPARVISLMYLPNDAALDKVQRADRDFIAKAAQHEIMLAGPAVLASALNIVACEITFARRVENQEKIIDTVKSLLDAVAVVLGHAAKVGKGIKAAADGYADLSASINRTLLSRARRLESFGVQHGKALPQPLPAYHVNIAETVIEGEAAEIRDDPPPLPRLVG